MDLGCKLPDDATSEARADRIAALLPARPSEALSLLLVLAAGIAIQSGYSEQEARATLARAFLRVRGQPTKAGVH